MAKKYIIDLDGPIGGMYANKHYVKKMLADHPNEEVDVRINSLGGAVDDGLDIASQFREHGNVTAHIFGLTASAATIAALGAKRIKMSRNSFVLFHRVSSWVDLWGQMNEEQIEQAIAQLARDKEDNKKFDLVIARMYADRCGKTLDEMHAVMCRSAWLTADEAKAMGFADELIDDTVLPTFTNSMATKFNALGVPLPPCPATDDEPSSTQSLVQAIVEGVRQAFAPAAPAIEAKADTIINKNNKAMRKNVEFAAINALLQVDGIDLNDEATEAALNEEQLHAIDSKMAALQSEIDSRTAELSDKATEIEDLQAKLAAANEEIEKLKAAPGDDDIRTHEACEDGETDCVLAKAIEMFNEIKDF